jgi:hypothetical protein
VQILFEKNLIRGEEEKKKNMLRNWMGLEKSRRILFRRKKPVNIWIPYFTSTRGRWNP